MQHQPIRHPDGEQSKQPSGPKFSPGQLVATPGALAAMNEFQCSPLSLLSRHLSGDWGQIDPGDTELNNQALISGGRLLSSYTIGPEVKVWLITEQMSSGNLTTYLLPAEY